MVGAAASDSLKPSSSEPPARPEVSTRAGAHYHSMTYTTINPSTFKHDALAAVEAFAQLSPFQLDQIASLSDERHIPAGETLCHQLDFGTDAFVIARGQVSIRVNGVEVAQKSAGEVVGDWAMFGSGHRSATLVAATDLDVVVVDASEIDLLCSALPSVARAFGPPPSSISR
jgi:CRP-like cAMP-binding protein